MDSFLFALSEHERAHFENTYVTGVQVCHHVNFICISFNDGELITKVIPIIIVTENIYHNINQDGSPG